MQDVIARPLEVALEGVSSSSATSAPWVGAWEGWLERFRSFRARDRVEVHLAVPRTIAAKVATMSADRLVSGVDGELSARTDSGALVVDGTSGRLGASTASGEIVARDDDPWSSDRCTATRSSPGARQGGLAPLEDGIADTVRERAARLREDVRGSMGAPRAELAVDAQDAASGVEPLTVGNLRTVLDAALGVVRPILR